MNKMGNESEQHGILDYACRAIDFLENQSLKESLRSAFTAGKPSLESVESFFNLLSAYAWPREALEVVMRSYREEHLTSPFMAALAIRIMRLASASEDARVAQTLYESSALVQDTIAEDLGVEEGKLAHTDLFQPLANAVCGDDDWVKDKHLIAEAREFREWVRKQRLESPLFDALATTISSEIFNHGEYSASLPSWETLLKARLRMSESQADQAILYVRIHTGDTESGHFLCAVQALEKYCTATGEAFDAERVGSICAEYIDRAGRVFSSLEATLRSYAPGKAA